MKIQRKIGRIWTPVGRDSEMLSHLDKRNYSAPRTVAKHASPHLKQNVLVDSL